MSQSSLDRGRFIGIKKFKKAPRYPHHRSDGMTHRRNAGSYLQPHA